jgi:DNA-directed RNA polymerase specialized sigma24 family protein
VAHEVEGVPVAVIADLEGVPVTTIYTRLRLARRDLRAAILRLRAKVAFERTPAIRRGKR